MLGFFPGGVSVAEGPLLDTRRHDTFVECVLTCACSSHRGSSSGDGRVSTPASAPIPHTGSGPRCGLRLRLTSLGWGLFQVAVTDSTQIETSVGAL